MLKGPAKALTLLLVDDHRIVRQGLRAVLRDIHDFRLVGEAGDGLEAVRLVERLRPDVLVLDLLLPGLNGFDVTRRVTRHCARPRVVILSMYTDVAYVTEALRAGATGYVLKESGVEHLVRAIREADAGHRYLSPPLAAACFERAENESFDPFSTLTHRERAVLQMTAEGHSSIEIAKRMFISRRTVEWHRANLMRKLGLRNQKEMVRYALQCSIPLLVNRNW